MITWLYEKIKIFRYKNFSYIIIFTIGSPYRMLKRLLGLDKKGFYLVLDEDKSSQDTTSKTSVATEPAQKAKTETTVTAVQKAEPKKPAAPKKKRPTAKKKTKAVSAVQEPETKVQTPAPTTEESVTKVETATPVAKEPETKVETTAATVKEPVTETGPVVVVKSSTSDLSLTVSEKYRNAFNTLSKDVFNLSFENWYKLGYWNDQYIPYTL